MPQPFMCYNLTLGTLQVLFPMFSLGGRISTSKIAVRPTNFFGWNFHPCLQICTLKLICFPDGLVRFLFLMEKSNSLCANARVCGGGF
jgi:hypothetical protein